jgi:hypothetical protein
MTDRLQLTVRRLVLWSLLCAVVASAGGCCNPCADPNVGKPPPRPEGMKLRQKGPCEGDRPYYLGNEQVQQDVADLFARVDGSTPAQWTETARKLTGYGERAVPQLVQNLGSDKPRVALMSAYVLGTVKDPRSLSALQQATLSSDRLLRYEAATAMVRMGDRRGLPTLIDGLEDPDPLVRARSILVLNERTGEMKGYKADGKPMDRAAAIARWRDWLARTGGV